jgi:hypothetical protein
MQIKVESVIVCEDIRKEINNKEILIGVYSGNIVVASYPAMLKLAFWVELVPDSMDVHHLSLKIESPSGNPPIEVEFDLSVKEANTAATIAFGNLPIAIERDGELKVSFKEGDGDWSVIKQKKVLRGPVSSA